MLKGFRDYRVPPSHFRNEELIGERLAFLAMESGGVEREKLSTVLAFSSL